MKNTPSFFMIIWLLFALFAYDNDTWFIACIICSQIWAGVNFIALNPPWQQERKIEQEAKDALRGTDETI